jgi:hypothetical protein
MYKVKIKTWDSMVKQYGLLPDGETIKCDRQFTVDMEKLLPKNRKITIDKDNQWVTKNDTFVISKNMIE